jgi:hypothetical protein
MRFDWREKLLLSPALSSISMEERETRAWFRHAESIADQPKN